MIVFIRIFDLKSGKTGIFLPYLNLRTKFFLKSVVLFCVWCFI